MGRGGSCSTIRDFKARKNTRATPKQEESAMINEKKLCEFLAGMYEHIQQQNESIYHLQRSTSALVQTMTDSRSEFARIYAANHQKFSEENSLQFSEAIQQLDELIRRLKVGKIP
jgi:hypothetical protein